MKKFLAIVCSIILSCSQAIAQSTSCVSPAWPIQQSVNNHFLQDSAGVPWFAMMDSAGDLMCNLSGADIVNYLNDRQAHGYNAIQTTIDCDAYVNAAHGDLKEAFDGTPEFSNMTNGTPNNAFFAQVDAMLTAAASRGITVVLNVAETNNFNACTNCGNGIYFWEGIGTTNATNLGNYLGTRYKNFTNIIWMVGNDFATWPTASDNAIILALANGILATDPNHIITTEMNCCEGASLDNQSYATILGVNGIYDWFSTFVETKAAYLQTPTTPAWIIEAPFEGENPTGLDPSTRLRQRKIEWWSFTTGALGGGLFGTHFWDFHSGWQAGIDSPGAADLLVWKNFWNTYAWQNLTPDGSGTFVTAGKGAFPAKGTAITPTNYATSAFSPDGTLGVVYVPNSRVLTVNMATFSRTVTARWFDPTNGTYTVAAGSPFPNTGSLNFTPPGNNAAGDPDLVLVMTAAALLNQCN